MLYVALFVLVPVGSYGKTAPLGRLVRAWVNCTTLPAGGWTEMLPDSATLAVPYVTVGDCVKLLNTVVLGVVDPNTVRVVVVSVIPL
jgi:hypothetical protein